MQIEKLVADISWNMQVDNVQVDNMWQLSCAVACVCELHSDCEVFCGTVTCH